jgi:hypothetical protein
LQKAIVATLKGNASVNAIIAGRIYDAVPTGAVKPYVSFGVFDLLPERGDCLEGAEMFITLDGWAAGPDTVQIKQLGAAVAAALDEAALPLDAPQRLVNLTLERSQYLRDPDGITAHAAMTFRAQTEPIN